MVFKEVPIRFQQIRKRFSLLAEYFRETDAVEICVKTRMHSSRMRIFRFLTISRSARGWVLPTPLDADLWCMLGSQSPFPVNRMTHRCQNITLPQTSFGGVKKYYNFEFKKLMQLLHISYTSTLKLILKMLNFDNMINKMPLFPERITAKCVTNVF